MSASPGDTAPDPDLQRCADAVADALVTELGNSLLKTGSVMPHHVRNALPATVYALLASGVVEIGPDVQVAS